MGATDPRTCSNGALEQTLARGGGDNPKFLDEAKTLSTSRTQDQKTRTISTRYLSLPNKRIFTSEIPLSRFCPIHGVRTGCL